MPQLDLFVYPTEIYSIAFVVVIIGGFMLLGLQQISLFFVLRRFDLWHFFWIPQQLRVLLTVLAPLLTQSVAQSLSVLHLQLLKLVRFQFFVF